MSVKTEPRITASNIGLADENINILSMAISYLKKNNKLNLGNLNQKEVHHD